MLLKEQRLRAILKDMGSCIVAFSGGADSSFIAVIAHQELGENALAITAESPSFPTHQRNIALTLVQRYSLLHEFIASGEMQDENYVLNAPNRCYFCKHDLYTKLQEMASQRGFRYVVDGSNLDDTGDYRPGRQAGCELKVRSPLIEAGFAKEDVRELSRRLKLPTADLPASACLSSRIPYGSPVTVEKLRMIDEGEEVLRSLGFNQFRVRHHGDVGRIEVAREEMPALFSMEMMGRIGDEFKRVGFKFVAVDVDGYRTGALNEVLTQIKGPHQ